MATASDVITELYTSGEIRKACLTITGGDPLWRDLEQETVLILLEKDPDKIMQTFNAGYLKFYVVRLIINLYRGKNNQFAHKYRQHDTNAEVSADLPADQSEYNALMDDLWAIAQTEMDSWAKGGAFPYDKTLLHEYMQTFNMKRLSRETNIPYRSIIFSIEKSKERIKAALETHGHHTLNPDAE